MSLFDWRSREQRFWDWFAKNSDRLHDFDEDNQEALFEELGRQLSKIERGLVFEIGPPNDVRELYISADGIEERFPAVERLVAAAPKLPNWQIAAFRQPGDPEATISFADQNLGADDIWFKAHRGEGKTDLDLYVRGMESPEDEAIGGAVFLLLDNLLGEYVVAKKIGGIEWHPLPADPKAVGLRPFVELRKVFGIRD
jgi:hypothetical protein